MDRYRQYSQPIVEFYVLNQKFVDRDEDVPEQSQQVMYYSLAIGHHVGVIDCFKPILQCPYEDYKQWLDKLPESEAKRKLVGLIKFGEIMIDITHINSLAIMFSKNRPHFNPQECKWTDILMATFAAIQKEPVMYLMVKRRG
ncbi:formate hydrogenlyase maturation HycH family protein [Bisgaard Taxon 45]